MTVVTLSVPHTPLGRSAPFGGAGAPGKEGLSHLPGRVKIHRWPMADCPVTNTFKVGYWRRSTPTAPVAEITTATAKALLGVKWSPKAAAAASRERAGGLSLRTGRLHRRIGPGRSEGASSSWSRIRRP